jgi:hypothetical protein
VTTTYTGMDPPQLGNSRAWSEANRLLEGCQHKLWAIRKSYWQRELGGSSLFPWLSCCLITCCVTSQAIERLESRRAGLAKKAFDLRNMLTRDAANTARKVSCTTCVTHQPPPPEPGSP